MMRKNLLSIFLLMSTFVLAQTPGFNYQALILNTNEIQIPGTDIAANKVPLGLEEITLRFTITNTEGIEYIEEHEVITDENGMVSLIVGEGVPITNSFSDVNWDGQLKYLSVELDILNNNEGFIFLDTQKILYIPHPTNGSTANVAIVASDNLVSPPFKEGDLVWVKEYGNTKLPTLIIYNGLNWQPVNNDMDPTNELGLIVVANNTEKEVKFPAPVIGDQVWNQTCECIEVYNGLMWVSSTQSSTITVSNGLTKVGNNLKLGGNLNEPTEIVTDIKNTLAIKGLETSTNNEDQIIVRDKNTGILKQKLLSTLTQQTQVVIIAADGQLEFSTPLNITSTDKIDVYRNGVRIDFTAVDATTIKLEPEAICYKNDKIRIVQIY